MFNLSHIKTELSCWLSIWCFPPTVHTKDEPFVMDDIAYDNENERNADQCTSRGCMWGKSSDGNVYVPYVIANHYCKWLNKF